MKLAQEGTKVFTLSTKIHKLDKKPKKQGKRTKSIKVRVIDDFVFQIKSQRKRTIEV